MGGYAVVAGRITLGDLIAFQIYLAMLIWPMVALGWVSNLFQRGAAATARLFEVLDHEPEIRDRAVGAQPDRAAAFRFIGRGARQLSAGA